jgi:hypothetical protein
MKPELVRFSDDTYIIIGAHLTLEEARDQFGKEYDSEVDAYDDEAKKEIFTPIESVKHWWVRYEFIGEDNCPDDFEGDPGDSMWILHEREKRPKGITRRATVINE